MSMKFRYTILYVNDVSSTISFYETAFGVERKMLHESGDYGELSTGGTTLAFSSHSLLRQLGKDPANPQPGKPTFEIAFETDQVDQAFDRAVKAGAKPVQEPKRVPWGQTIAYVTDQNGFLIEICSPVEGG